uniref:Uncharacterized protein n=1 Tax=Arundo donax TaxID=35708 RepID=A0A0A9HYH2_ARUDO
MFANGSCLKILMLYDITLFGG